MTVESLAAFPYVIARVGCRLCKRSGAYRLARLAAKFGPEIDMDGLMDELARDCPYRPGPLRGKARKYTANCEARFIDIVDPNPPPPHLPPAMGRLRVVGGTDWPEDR